MPSTAVFTIVSKNYWHFARTLMDSLRVHQPEWNQYVLLVDELDPAIQPEHEAFTTVLARDLSLPDEKRFFFRYTILELNTAVKPWMFEWLFKKGYEQVVFFDPDIFIYAPLTALQSTLNDAFIVLTPHLTHTLDNAGLPDERTILLAGTYNLGFIAIHQHAALAEFLAWWQSKLERDCVSDLERGLFVDQKWLDLAPGLFPDVKILRDSGYNVAYWNLPERHIAKPDSGYTVNGAPLVFFHFSGLSLLDPEQFSKHQNRFRVSDLQAAQPLVNDYRQSVLDHGYQQYSNLPYAYGIFANGTLIPDLARFAYRETPSLESVCGTDPFASFAPFNQSARQADSALPLITHLMRALWERRPDLRAAFPDPYDRDRVSYAYWFADNAASYAHLPSAFIAPVRDSLNTHEQSLRQVAAPSASPLPARLARRAYQLGLRAKSLVPLPLLDERRAIKDYLLRKMSGPATQPPASPVRTTPTWDRKPGLNLIGYLKSATGVGESARASLRAAQAAQLPLAALNFTLGNIAAQDDESISPTPSTENPFTVNLFHINADQMPLAAQHFGPAFFDRHYNIGYWAWELTDFPEAWLSSAQHLQEIWVPSSFVQNAVSQKVSIPVIRMPHAIELGTIPNLTRQQLGLPQDKLIFLCMFDALSYMDRKNPQGVITAFRQAFPSDPSVALVIKVSHANLRPAEVQQLRECIGNQPNIYLLDQSLTRPQVVALLSHADVYVSLHRAEGFGLVLAESMLLGKPVIATQWSGNLDFMNNRTAALVGYQLTPILHDLGPYPAGQLWADPDLSHAAQWMQQLATNQSLRHALGLAAQQSIQTQLSPQTIGALYRQRLQRLGLL